MEGSGGGGPTAAYVEAIRMIFKVGLNDKSAAVRTAAAGCLRAVGLTGGPGVASGGLEACINLCLKVLSGLNDCSLLLPLFFERSLGLKRSPMQAGAGGCISMCSGWLCLCSRSFAGSRLKPSGAGNVFLLHYVLVIVFI